MRPQINKKAAFVFTLAVQGIALPCAFAQNEALDEGKQAVNNEANAGQQNAGAREGWQLEYGGFRKTPILFDPMDDPNDPASQRVRVYPPLNSQGLGDKQTFNLSVDDELQKTALAVFQPISQSNDLNSPGLSIQSSFANSEQLRDNHLNMFRTVRAVAIMTLSYLDKTVAAGLATTQQQVDNDTTHQLLKQISWSTAKLATPERERMFTDVDEKFEKCMLQYNGNPSTHLAHVNIDDAQSACTVLYPSTPSQSGIYHFCVCVAETSTDANWSTVPQGGGSQPEYSTVQRVFFGLKVPQGQAFGWQGNAIVEMAKHFRNLYGDIVYRKQQGVETQKFEFVSPYWSIPDAIAYIRDKKIYRNGGSAVAESCNTEPPTFTYCPITGGAIEIGICPAFRQLLEWEHAGQLENMRLNNFQQLNRQWIEASLGGPITIDDIVNIVAMANVSDPNTALFDSVTNGQSSNKKFYKFVESFCDASAVTAFKKMHVRMLTIAADHMNLNRKTTTQDRIAIKQLMARASDYLELGGIDSRSHIENMLQSVAIENDRKIEAGRSAAWAAAVSAQETQQQLGEILPQFGGTMDIGQQTGP